MSGGVLTRTLRAATMVRGLGDIVVDVVAPFAKARWRMFNRVALCRRCNMVLSESWVSLECAKQG